MNQINAMASLAALMGIFALAGCNEKPTVTAPVPQPVRITTVAFADDAVVHKYSGIVKARIESDLGFRVAGKIVQRFVDVGATVKPGDLIAKLDATDFQLALESQTAELAAATSTRDQAVAAEGRYRALLGRGFVAQAALEQRTATADEARQRVEKATRAIATAKNQIAYTELRADAPGVIASLPVEVGQVVAAGQTVARLAKTGELEVQVAIPEQQVAELAASKATVELWSNTTTTYEAALREISPEADPTSRTYQARYTIKAPTDRVAMGMTATVTLTEGGGHLVARLPLPAVHNDGRGASVFVLDETQTRIKRTSISILAYDQSSVIVTGGVVDGQRIVSLGAHVLDENRPVRVVENETSKQAALR